MNLWTIGGSSPDAQAGILLDVKVAHALGVSACSVLTAVTAQNPHRVTSIQPVSEALFQAQWETLRETHPPAAIKIGLVGTVGIARLLHRLLSTVDCPIVLDPVFRSGSGFALGHESLPVALREFLFPHATCLTANLLEAEVFLGKAIQTDAEADTAARCLQEMLTRNSDRSVLLKGGHLPGRECADRWTNGTRSLRFSTQRFETTKRTHGTGCALSTAIAVFLGRGFPADEASARAKTFLNRGIRRYDGNLDCRPWPEGATTEDLPKLEGGMDLPKSAFPALTRRVGFYPIVDSADWIERLVSWGVGTAQLRIKELSSWGVREIRRASEIASQAGMQLFINDHWREATEARAFGVHLGQTDLDSADLRSIHRAGLRLGVSTHSYLELMRAVTVRPTYVALGPIFPTTTKTMSFSPQGLEAIQEWKRLTAYPLVAIGGLTLEHADAARQLGADGVSVVRDLTLAADPKARTEAWMRAT